MLINLNLTIKWSFSGVIDKFIIKSINNSAFSTKSAGSCSEKYSNISLCFAISIRYVSNYDMIVSDKRDSFTVSLSVLWWRPSYANLQILLMRFSISLHFKLTAQCVKKRRDSLRIRKLFWKPLLKTLSNNLSCKRAFYEQSLSLVIRDGFE